MNTQTRPGAPLLVTGAHLIDPAAKKNGPADLLVVDGLVAAVGKPGELKARAKALKAEVFPADGLFMAPGFVDLNCVIHEPGAEHLESFASGSRAAAGGGYTSLLVKPLSEPVNDNAFMTDFVSRRARERSLVRVYPMGALSAGREGKRLAEVGAMVAAGARAVGDGVPMADAYLMRKSLEYCRAFDVPVFSFPEERALAGQGVMNEGWNSNRLGLRGIPPAAEEIAVARDLVLARHTKGRLHLQSISTMGALSVIRHARSEGLEFSAETNPAYFSLTSDAIATYDANFKCSPPLRSEEDVAAIIEALADGTLDCIATAHQPQTLASKEQAFEHASVGMIGLGSAFHLTLALVRKKKISPLRMVELLSLGPARVLGLAGEIGTLAVGARADFVVFDPKEDTVFSLEGLPGAARNSPFLGQSLPGVVHGTFVNGVRVYAGKGRAK